MQKKSVSELPVKEYSDANNEIKPDYAVIKEYINDPVVNERRFRKNFESLINRNEYKIFIDFLEEKKLTSDHNLYFFWVHYTEYYEHYKWAFDTDNYKIWNDYNEELKDLKEKFAILKSSYDCPPAAAPYRLRSVVFNLNSPSNKTDKVKITAHPLMFDIYCHLSEFVNELDFLKHPDVKNKSNYFKQFIYETIPFFEYLKATYLKSTPDIKIYEFITGFLETIGIKWAKDLIIGDLPELYIKARYNEFKRQNIPPTP